MNRTSDFTIPIPSPFYNTRASEWWLDDHLGCEKLGTFLNYLDIGSSTGMQFKMPAGAAFSSSFSIRGTGKSAAVSVDMCRKARALLVTWTCDHD